MHRWIRNTHLLLGAGTALFLLLYGVSAVQMSYSKYFKLKPTIVRAEAVVPPGERGDPHSVAQYLMSARGLRGEMKQVKQTPEGFSLNIVRPGVVSQVRYSNASGIASIQTNTASMLGVLNRLHHMAGMQHEYWLHNVWGVFVALVSIALIAVSLTGIYLWFKLHTQRVSGAILLGASLVFSVVMLAIMRTA